jgi:aconitate hydratase A / 2-methylisocitrate dehydratase
MQDFTGVPCVVDLVAMREAMADLGGDPRKINPLIPAELVIDHSVIADVFGHADAFRRNADLEFERNQSGTSSCAGPSSRSTTSSSCHRIPASATR